MNIILDTIKCFTIVLFVFLGACTKQPEECNGTVYSTPEYSTEWMTVQASSNMLVSPATISTLYADTMACLGLTATGVTIAYKSFSDNFIGATWAGYIPSGRTIWINTDSNEIWLPRTCKTDKQALRHEMIHHILEYNNIPNNRHQSTLFKCGAGVDNG